MLNASATARRIGPKQDGADRMNALNTGPTLGDADRNLFERELNDFLPRRIFDAHAHLFDAGCFVPGAELPPKSCYRRFGGAFTLEQYQGWSADWLPERTLFLNSFGHPSADTDRVRSAAYTGAISDNRRTFGMLLVAPRDPVAAIEALIREHALIGYKPYLNYVDWKPAAEVTIDDMLPAAQLELAERLGLVVTLHIPRAGRLADPVNQAQMTALCRRYPNTTFIFAHIGRAYFLNNVIGRLDGLAACPNAFLDTAMVNHEGVLEYALRHFPRERILFGSDAPIALLRGKSVEINDQYAYLMGEDYMIGTAIVDTAHAVAFTTFFYEQLRGIRLAAARAGLTAAEVERLFFENAHRLFTAAAARIHRVEPAAPPPDINRSHAKEPAT
jgi:glutamate-1-semialdehyde 2,1-aminomutase